MLWTPSVIDPTWIRENTREDARLVNVSRLGDDEMHKLYKRAASEKLRLVRLHSGDPATWSWLRQHIDVCTGFGLEIETIPGVQAASAAAVSLGVSLTETELTESVILSGVDAATLPDPARIREFAQHGTTLAVVLPAVRAAELAESLRAGGFDGSTPVVVAYKVSWSDELIAQTTIEELVDTVKGHRLWRHTLFLVGGALRPGTVKSPAATATATDTARRPARRTPAGGATGSRWSARARSARRGSTASPVPAVHTRRPGSKKAPSVPTEQADSVNGVAAAVEPEPPTKSTVDELVAETPDKPGTPVRTTRARAKAAAPVKTEPATRTAATRTAATAKTPAAKKAAAAAKRPAPRSSATAKADTVTEEPTSDTSDTDATSTDTTTKSPTKSAPATKSTGRAGAKSKGKSTAKSRTGSTKRGQSPRNG